MYLNSTAAIPAMRIPELAGILSGNSMSSKNQNLKTGIQNSCRGSYWNSTGGNKKTE